MFGGLPFSGRAAWAITIGGAGAAVVRYWRPGGGHAANTPSIALRSLYIFSFYAEIIRDMATLFTLMGSDGLAPVVTLGFQDRWRGS